MSHAAAALQMTEGQRATLGAIAKSTMAAHGEVLRARALLMAADGAANSQIARDVGVSLPTVRDWRSRFVSEGLGKFGEVRKGRGRKPTIPQEKVDEMVRLTQGSKPKGQTQWSCRTMAKQVGVSPATVQRVWSARGLKPHRVETFKLPADKHFDQKLVDVVGLYLNPPDKAVVLCLDEKSQIQALDRTQPSLPMKKGRAGTMTHDYKRHGTTTLFAALDVLTGKVTGQCLPQHTNHELLHFLKSSTGKCPRAWRCTSSPTTTRPEGTTTSRAGWPSTLAGTCTSRPLRALGSTSSNGGSGSSLKKPYAVVCSALSPTSWQRSMRTWTPTTKTPSPSCGPPPPSRSWRRSDGAALPWKD